MSVEAGNDKHVYMNQVSRTPKHPVVLLLSGPNLNLLGTRQQEIYGSETLAEHVETATDAAEEHGLALEHLQSNHEGDLIDAIGKARNRVAAIVINAGALSHYSRSISDALAAFEGVIVELHLSNLAAREPWRSRSVLAGEADGTITGFGGLGYRLAIQAVAALLASRSEK